MLSNVHPYVEARGTGGEDQEGGIQAQAGQPARGKAVQADLDLKAPGVQQSLIVKKG